MRITYLINGFNGGGAALPVPDVVDALQSLGHDVEVVALIRQDGRAQARLEAAGVRQRILGPEKRIGATSLIRLHRHLRASRPDLLWTSLATATLLGQVAGAALGVPVISWQHNTWLKPGNRLLMRLSRRLTRFWVADSVAVRDWAIRELKIAPTPFFIWPLFVADPAVPVATEHRAGSGPFVIGSLGRLHPNKRYDVLVRAAARMKQIDAAGAAAIRIVVAGAGDQLPALLALATQLGVDNLSFEGYAASPQSFLAGLHAYVQPSRNEGLCLAAHEAMQAALPVIATPVGQMAHSVVDGVTGWRVPVDDVDALARALLAAAADPGRAARLGREARLRVLDRYGRAAFLRGCAEIMRHVQAALPAAQRADFSASNPSARDRIASRSSSQKTRPVAADQGSPNLRIDP